MLRSSVGIVGQFKIEGTAGEGGAANRYAEALKWIIDREFDPKNFRGSGNRIPSVKVHHKKMARGSVEGVLDYNTFPYLLNGLLTPGSRAQIDTSGGYQQIFTAGTRTADSARKTFAVEIGDATACEDYNFVQLLGLNIESNQEEFTVKSDLIAQFPNDNQALAGSPTVIEPRPVERDDVDVYADTSFGGIGGTKLTEVQAESLQIGNKFKEAFFHNSSNASFADVIELAHDVKFMFESAHNSQSRTLVAAISAAPTLARWIRWQALGKVLGQDAASADVREMIRIELKIQFDAAKEKRVDDAPYAYGYEASAMPDSGGLTTHLKITTINGIATL